MAWYLNRFLTTWREQVNRSFPHRTKASDGTIGDAAHSARTSEHNADTDGSVDAWDCDVNLLGSADPTGSMAERSAMWQLVAEFQRQPQAQLWIFRGKIANRDVGNWTVRSYGGASPHDHHCHFQSRTAGEKKPYTGNLDDVLPATNRTGDDMTKTELIAFLKSDEGKQLLGRAVWGHDVGSMSGGSGANAHSVLVTANTRADYLANKFAPALSAAVAELDLEPADVDEDALAAKLAGLIPDSLAGKVADELRDRLAA